jgi:hypothetical protein
LSAALEHYGLANDFKSFVIGLAILYRLMLVGLAASGWIAFGRGRPERGRVWLAKAALFAALPLMHHRSAGAL